ncbi:MAG TPA: hypothetical protein VHM26_19070, partial [Chitinophagaceae bacterium]|nr:hypothetical protein [Chitinophagaceae bacterium]
MDKPRIADLQKEKFFRIAPNTDPLVKAIAANIQRQDTKRNLTGKLISKAGFPIWDKAQISKAGYQSRITEGEQQVFIPFINEEEEETKAVLAVKINATDTLFTMVYGSNYRQYGFDSTNNDGSWSARKVFGVFTYFDHLLFNRNAFQVSNSQLLGAATDTITGQPAIVYLDTVSSSQGRLFSPNPGTIIVYITYVYCQYPGGRTAFPSSRMVFPNCYNATYTQQQVTFHLDENAPGGGYFDGDGGGGDGGVICMGCSWEDVNPCNLDPMAPQEPCHDDWQPVENAQPEPYDPYNSDSVRISDVIRDSFPCLYSFLKDSLPNANMIAQLAGTDLFSDSAYMHLDFDTSQVVTGPAQATGLTYPKFSLINGGRIHYKATIKLNPWHLKHASKELMIATIIHESMHAIFKLRWWEYQLWLNPTTRGDITTDSTYIKTHFPLHWNYMNGSPFTATQQHEIMATDYFQKFEDAMRPWYNPNAGTAIRDSVIKALGYGGLYETDAWKMLPSMGMDTCKYKAM